MTPEVQAFVRQFQLHHTGIKTDNSKNRIAVSALFQLHHTGIKTLLVRRLEKQGRLFQLHHTGIKTGFRWEGGFLTI